MNPPAITKSEDDWMAALDAAVAELNEHHFVAMMDDGSGRVRIAKIVPDDGAGCDHLVFMRQADMRRLYSHRRYKVGETQCGCDIIKGLGEAWISHPKRRTYYGSCPPDVYNPRADP